MSIDAPAATVSAAGGSADERVQCPECAFVARNTHGLHTHFTRRHRGIPVPAWIHPTLPPRSGGPVPDAPSSRASADGPASPLSAAPSGRSSAELEAIRSKFQKGVENVGGLVYMAGFRVTGVVVQRRAKPVSFEALALGERYPGVLRAVEAFNALMDSSRLIELGTAVSLGVGVDVGALHPAKPVKVGPLPPIPGFLVLQPIEADIIEAQRIQERSAQLQQEWEAEQAARAAAAAANGMAHAEDATAAAGAE